MEFGITLLDQYKKQAKNPAREIQLALAQRLSGPFLRRPHSFTSVGIKLLPP